MSDQESIAGPLIAFFFGLAMFALGAFSIGLFVLGGEPLTKFILWPFWMFYGLVAVGLGFMWKYFRWRAEFIRGGARTR